MTPNLPPDLPGAPRRIWGVHPRRFMMYLYLLSTLMMFAGLTSAVIVMKGDWLVKRGTWGGFVLPDLFLWSTVLVAASSVPIQWAYVQARRNRLRATQAMLGLTALMGVGFLLLQLQAYGQLVGKGVYVAMAQNPSGPFVYVLSFLHGLHMVAAVLAVGATLVAALRRRIDVNNPLGLELAATFWHAMGLLWVYLFLFLRVMYSPEG